MKKYVILVVVLLLISIITAIPVPESKAISVAKNWMDMQSYDRVNTSQPATVHKVYNNETVNLYVINYSENGFIIISGDDRCQPILGWSDEGNLSLDSDNPGVQYWLNSFSNEVSYIIENNFSSEETRALWQEVSSNSFNRNLRNVEPLLPCRWNQDWPYNALCPEDPAGPGGRVYVGCVATAMAQCMRYWNYPPQGNGNHGYYASGYGYQSVNYNNSTYDWWQMPITAGSDYDMIAKLSYDCAVSVDMMFAPDGSGAYSWEVPNALETYFGYSNSAAYESRSDYSTSAWNSMLRAELDADRVIYYSGHGDDGGGGHAFVLDGYREDNFFHFDFGWSGSGNGYYTVSNLNPQGNFNAGQGAVIGIQPQNYQPNEGVLIWDGMNSADCSGSEIYVTLSGMGTSTDQADSFPYDLVGYEAAFLSFGNTQTGYTELTEPMADAIRRFLQSGGSLYIEGADVLGVDQSSNSALHDLLGIDEVIDGVYNDISALDGVPFSVGMDLNFADTYQTNLETMDRYIVGDGQPVFTEDNYGVVAVQNLGIYGQKSITMSYSLARLENNAAKTQFIHNVMNFFENTTSVHPIMDLSTVVEANESVTLTWSHPGLASSSLLGYNIFDNGELVQTIYDRYMTTHTFSNVSPGLHLYSVTAGYLAGESSPSSDVEAFVYGNQYTDIGPSDYSAETGLVLNPGGMAAVKYEITEPINLEFISFYIEEASTNPMVFRVWNEIDNEPGDMLAQLVYRDNIVQGWHTIDVADEDMNLNENFYIGVVYTVNSSQIGVDTESLGSTIFKQSNSDPWESFTTGNLMVNAILNTATANDEVVNVSIPNSLSNYPNPFNPSTTISFDLKEAGKAELVVYDVKGRRVNTLLNDMMQSGTHEITWNGLDSNGNDVSSGVYFFKLNSTQKSVTHKALLLK